MQGKEANESLIRLKDLVESGMLSDGEFSRRLSDALDQQHVTGVSAWISVKWQGNVVAKYHPSADPDEPADGPNFYRSDFPLQAVSVHIALRISGSASGKDDLIDHFKAVFRAHWGNRDSSVLIENLKFAGVEGRLNNSLARANGSETTILRLDLDKFKSVNDNFGYEKGSEVLIEFASRVRRYLSDLAIVVRQGGDEFFAFFIGVPFETAMLRTNSLHAEMAEVKFKAIGEARSASIGISLLTEPVSDHVAALKSASELEERLKKNGTRNFIAIVEEPKKPIALTALTEEQLAEIAIHCRSLGQFANNRMAPVLGAIIFNQLENSPIDEIAPQLDEIKRRFQVNLRCDVPISDPGSVSCEFSPQEWAAIVVQSLLFLYSQQKGPLSGKDHLRFKARPNELALEIDHEGGTAAIHLCPLIEAQPDLTADIGRGWAPSCKEVPGAVSVWLPDPNSMTSEASPVVLMPIGDNALSVARHYEGTVAGIVAVDDRPVTGGGLPDFWQSNVARLIHAALRNPNVSHVLVIGDTTRARRTVGYLQQDAKEWRKQSAALPEKLAISHALVTQFIDRNLSVTVSAPENVSSALCSIYSNITEGVRPDQLPIDLEREAQRRRILAVSQLPNEERLLHRDGLRAKTLADAYPRVIHILRSESQEPNQPELAGRQFRELTGFKLVLENPFVDEVPHYWSSEQEEFKYYYEHQFCGPTEGTFGPRLLKERLLQGGAIQQAVRASALDQVENAIRDQRATRRVMLSVAEAEDLGQPLGLAHIQVLPRFIAQQWRLDFLWVWRTVEALVGLPFSAYGSVRWSMEFLEELKIRLGASIPLESGNLTYVAMSLHMYMDDGDREIARTIVQHASV